MTQLQDQLRALLAASSDAVYRMSPDWSQMRQLDGRDFIEDTRGPSSTWRDRYIHPSDRAVVDAHINEAIRTRTVFELEHRVVRADGTLGWTFSRAVPLFDAQGEIVEWIGMASDVTRRKQAEAQLRASEGELRAQGQRLELALGAGRMGTWELDLAGNELRSSNTCKANYGRGPSESFTYTELAASVHDSHRERWAAVVTQAISDGSEFEIEYPVNWPDGTEHWVHVRGRCNMDAAGIPQSMSGVSFEITQRKHVEQALRDSDRRKDEFLATLAHELRNPLAPVRAGLSVLRLKGVAPEDADVLATMDRQLTHMVRMIDDLLDLSRVSRGKVELRRSRVDVRTAIEHAVEASRPLIDAGQHVLTVTLPGEPIWLDADLTRMAQVLGNVITNAAKYTAPGGRIEVASEREGDEVLIRVRDSGIGISRDMLEHVFEMFAQVGRNMHPTQSGLGIGLALAKLLVSMHGGSISADSAGVGTGSVFTIRLPIDSSAPEPKARITMPQASTKSRHIMVVDDNVDGAEMLAMLLDLLGHTCVLAHDGRSALELARKEKPEIVFLDLGLPDINGYEVARAFRADAQLRATTLIALTGWGSLEDKQRSREAGFDLHLTKPVDADAVSDALDKASQPHSA